MSTRRSSVAPSSIQQHPAVSNKEGTNMQNNTLTIGEAITRFGVQVDDHLSREATIPVLTGPQAQGDTLILPAPDLAPATTPIPAAGVAVVKGEAGGNTH